MQTAMFMREIRLGIKSLLLHKLRSLLTMLGVVFGVGSVIAMLSIGEGAKEKALQQIEKLGSQNIIIESQKPKQDVQDSSGSGASSLSMYGLKYDDYNRILDTYKDKIEATVPVRDRLYESRFGERQLFAHVIGTNAAWFDLVDRPVIAGRTLTQYDIDTHAGVVVLSEKVARHLLATEHALGENIRIEQDYFKVIGVVKADSDPSTPDSDIDIYMPISTFTEHFGEIYRGVTSGSFTRERVELNRLMVKVKSRELVEPTAAAITHMLERNHKDKDYAVNVPLALLKQAQETQQNFTNMLVAIASVSLLVGGIGIMNIMLANVTERTREIGVRRAIGAKRTQIIRQFLIESIVLSMVGGIIGIVFGICVPFIAAHFSDTPAVISYISILLSLGISVAVGIAFGVYPAMQAASVDPIIALRHE